MRAGARVRGVARGRAEHAAGGARVAWVQGRAGPGRRASSVDLSSASIAFVLASACLYWRRT